MRFQSQQFGLIQRGKPVQHHRADVATRTFDPQDFGRFAGQGIGPGQFGRSVAPAEIGDGQIRAKQVGAVQQQLFGGERVGMRLVPPTGGHGKAECGRSGERGLVHARHLTRALSTINLIR